MPFSVYLFDVDGTLVDSAPDICGAVLEVLSATSCKPVTAADLRKYIGVHLFDMFQDLLPEYTTGQYDELIRHYRRVYPARGHKSTKVYPGVTDLLSALPGRKATATTKSTQTTQTVLGIFGLLPYFDHVQGTDGFPAKPAPDVILAAVKALGARPEDCLMVGDSCADMEAGRRAGVRTCAVRYGYGDPEELARWEPDYWISHPEELLSITRANGRSSEHCPPVSVY
jgi:phosphoglycolate phosphatase